MAKVEHFPPVGFHFRVEFHENKDLDGQEYFFQEVSGLSASIGTYTKKAGGENRFDFRLPDRSSYSNLTLKRGLLSDSKLIDWFKGVQENLEVETANVLIVLLNENHEPLKSFLFVNAWPQKWSLSNFNAEESKIVLETLELAYQYFKIL